MDVTLDHQYEELGRRFTDLLADPETAPIIRRMGELPRHADLTDDAEAAGAADGAQLRAAVWAALVDLGAGTLLLPHRMSGQDLGQQGAVVLTEALGEVLYQGPLMDTLSATDLMLRADIAADDLLARIGTGTTVALAVRERAGGPFRPGPIEVDDAAGVIRAGRRLIGFADADLLLAVGQDSAGGVRVALVARDDPAVRLHRHDDVSRGQLHAVELAGARVLAPVLPANALAAAWPVSLAAARIRQAAYLVGLAQGALNLAVERSRRRRQFGQSIGRFQSPAFRLAELATRIEAARWLVRATAWDCDQGEDARLGALQVLAMAADVAGETTLAAMQMHGAYGTTEDSDAQLYYRRAAVDRVWLGTSSELRTEAIPLLRAQATG